MKNTGGNTPLTPNDSALIKELKRKVDIKTSIRTKTVHDVHFYTYNISSATGKFTRLKKGRMTR